MSENSSTISNNSNTSTGNLSEYFAQPMKIEHWMWAMENHVAPWVKAKGKSYRELVVFV